MPSKLSQLIKKVKRVKDDQPKLKAAIAGQITKEVKKSIQDQIMSGAGYAPISSWTPKFNSYHRVSRRGGGVPLLDTGALLADTLKNTTTSNTANGLRITSYSTLPQARFLQHGGTTPLGTEVPARPYIELAFGKNFKIYVKNVCRTESKKYLKTIFER